jgi:pre-mRNA-splicing helicase BRR2
MESEPELLKILQALQAIDKEDIVSEERSRRDQARKSRVAADIEAMDTDDTQVLFRFFMSQLYCSMF